MRSNIEKNTTNFISKKMLDYAQSSRKFIFETYRFDVAEMKAHFYYSLLDEKNPENSHGFEEIIDFDDPRFDVRSDMNFEVLENILFHLHMALWISYYKAYPTEKLIIKSGNISETSLNFWKKFYINGLGEFLFENKISPKNLFQFECQSERNIEKKEFSISEKSLVPIWWGKDSIVSLELLQKNNFEFDSFVFGKVDQIKQDCINISGKNNFFVSRKISPNLFQLNEQWYFNGHVPITGIIAFVMHCVAYIYDYKYLVLSNELSANFWNTLWEWVEINHQWSKSLEFEKDLQKYVQENISDEIKYFSLLRGMYEIKIAELFSQLGKKYFWVFSSCNNNFKIQNQKNHTWIWCNTCPKCAFVYTMLHPFLTSEELIEIFWKDLYEQKDLENLFDELLWISGLKPFECVGTNEEVTLAMYYSYTKNKNKKLPYILEKFEKKVLPNFSVEMKNQSENKLFHIDSNNIIPEKFKKIL